MYVCVCNAITETQVRESVAAGAHTLEALQLETGLASCCGTCAEAACSYLPQECPGHALAQAAQAAAPVALLKDCAPVRWVTRAPHATSKAA